MTPSEYQILLNGQISHAARSLYTLHLLRMAAKHHPVRVSYADCLPGLSTPGDICDSSRLTILFQELIAIGLVQCLHKQTQAHYHDTLIKLPHSQFMATKQTPSSGQFLAQVPMCAHWRPDEQFARLSRFCGLACADFSEPELGEFIAYWLGRPEVLCNQHHWMMKFIKFLKNKRVAKPMTTFSNVGYQPMSMQGDSTHLSPRAQKMIAEAEKYMMARNHVKR